MSITITCPRCHTSLAAPDKLAGTYAFCPKCQGRMWVPAATTATHVATGGAATAVASVGTTVVASGTPSAVPALPTIDPMAPVRSPIKQVPLPSPVPAAASGAEVDAPPPVVQRAAPARRVAQFIAADAAQSQLTVAADGKLPELSLSSDEAAPRKRKGLGSGGNSWGLVILVSLSLLASLVILFLPGPSGNHGEQRGTQRDRERLKSKYIGSKSSDLRPYQVRIRRALQAHDRGDFKSERQYYLEVLAMLRDENLHPLGRNLTGMTKEVHNDSSLISDEDLERIVSNLLRQR